MVESLAYHRRCLECWTQQHFFLPARDRLHGLRSCATKFRSPDDSRQGPGDNTFYLWHIVSAKRYSILLQNDLLTVCLFYRFSVGTVTIPLEKAGYLSALRLSLHTVHVLNVPALHPASPAGRLSPRLHFDRVHDVDQSVIQFDFLIIPL